MRQAHCIVPTTTSSPKSPSSLRPRAPAQDGLRPNRSTSQSPPRSPALSTASTADDETSSPFVPHLTAPLLPKRALELLRTPPAPSRVDNRSTSPYVTASWGSPYPTSEEANLRPESSSSEASDDPTIHRLELDTPFLRPAPYLEVTPADQHPASLADILVNRARRPDLARGLTEDWIRQHTAADEHVEPRHWFSDGSDSEHSSLSGSPPRDEAAWFEDVNTITPKAQPSRVASQQSLTQHPRGRSSTETLKQSTVDRLQQSPQGNMATIGPEGSEPANHSNSMAPTSTPDDRPTTPDGAPGSKSDSVDVRKKETKVPVTPTRAEAKKESAPTPRIKKRVPWRGKNIMVLLPRDEGRGRPGNRPIPLKAHEVRNMFREWEQLGYDIRGFDLNEPTGYSVLPVEHYSRSREEWPDVEDTKREWAERKFKVALPDIESWKRYVDELNEAKLRALGVSFGDEPAPPPPPPASISPNPQGLNRRATITQYPPLPFSPPVPPSSASSQGLQHFPFPGQSAPGSMNAVASPSFNANFNAQHPAAISPNHPPFGFMPPQPQPSPRDMLLQQQGMHRVSPSLSTSPFGPGGYQPPHPHQRHQSLQFPQLPHQQFMPPRSTPHLQELREEDEEEQAKSPSKTPEPGPSQIRHNASDSLQREIDEAEYHLEEQFRSQLEHDQDYSPHNEEEKTHAAAQPAPEPSMKFGPQAPQFENTINDDLVLHHPRPHSRGHSLSQKYFGEDDIRTGSGIGGFGALNTIQDDKAGEELETNPSNLSSPDVEKLSGMPHDRTFSNPWKDVQSTSRRPSLDGKPPLSKFNVAAPEFKFNPTSSFQPGQFNFGSNTFQPAAFQTAIAPNPPESVESSQFSPPAAPSSKINVNAPVFSPRSSEFNFSAVGAPNFRPDAPAFSPFQSFNGSVTSPVLSGSESGVMPGSIFGNVDLNMPDIVKPAKQSKAIPIMRPRSHDSDKGGQHQTVTEDENGRIVDESRIKRFRSASVDGDEEVRFAEPSGHIASIDGMPEDDSADKAAEDERPPPETGMSSTIVSDSTDAKDTTSLSEVSGADQNAVAWAPVELTSQAEISDFNAARPFGEDAFRPHHKKSLSASARPFVPGMSLTDDDDEKEDTPVPGHFDESLLDLVKQAAVSPVEEITEEILHHSIEDQVSSVASQEGDGDASFDPSRFIPSPSPVNMGLGASRFASMPSPAKGLSASKYARSPSAVSEVDDQEPQEALVSSVTAEDLDDTQGTVSGPASPPAIQFEGDRELREPTFEEIDEVMQQMNEDPTLGVKKTIDSPMWQPSPSQPISIPGAVGGPESPKHIHPRLRDNAPSPSPRHYHLPIGVHQPLHAAGPEDPFVDPPAGAQISHLNTSESQAASDDWERAFSDEEQNKLDSRATFFDGRVNELVDGVLETRLGSLEKTLGGIQKALASFSERAPTSRRERRSVSAEVKESDADDEDDEPVPRRSMSPRKDRRMDQIRAAVMEAMAIQQHNHGTLPQLPPSAGVDEASSQTIKSLLSAIEEMKQQFSDSLHLDFRAEDLRTVVEEAVESRLPPPPTTAPVVEAVDGREDLAEKLNELSTRYADLEQRFRLEEMKSSTELASRRIVEDRAAEFERQLHMAETRLEVEIINRSVYDQRVVELEDKLRHQEEMNESEVSLRRAAEDRLAEVQRLLRISSEEEIRLRENLEEKEERVKILDAHNNKNQMRLALLEASVETSQKDRAELESRVEIAEVETRDSRQEANRWRIEAERAIELSKRQGDDLHHALAEKKQLHVLIDTLGNQMNENERVREGWRAKFISLQEDMARATYEIAEENGRRAKKEQAMLARQEVLDAKLQAESRTRERLETEMERLEAVERQGMKAINEAKRLDALLGEMRTENHKLQQSAMRYQAEFQEARESGAREVQRTRDSTQGQIEAANHQVNMVREQLEAEISRLQAQLEQATLEGDTVRSRYDMVVEDARSHSKGDVNAIIQKHQDEMEDMQARYDRQLSNAMEDAQRAESNLLERLSISTSKCEHLQDRVAHLEEKLEITREAARAAAQAAKASGVASPLSGAAATPPLAAQPAPVTQDRPQPRAVSQAMQLPQKISPQALRESIMVLQEQLQDREQKIEGLEQTISKLDPEAETKISKRDDEIVWLRELLAVRHSDLQDIITALGRDDYDQERVRDAAIRLKANLQMEQQERERAMNGGSNINLPNIAASLRDRAPGVVQAVGPLAAALGNWRKAGSFTSSKPSPALGGNSATPQKDGPVPQSSFLSGLLTPPQSNIRQMPPTGQQTAFSATGRRFTPRDLANRPKPPPMSQRQAGKMPARDEGSPPLKQSEPNLPQTPPMMAAVYDDDALAQDEFDDAGFFDEE